MGPFIEKKLSAVTLEDVQRLVINGVPESVHLDYKQSFALDDRGKRELLKDVTAFANEQGGTIIIGIEEGRDDEGKPNGVPVTIPGVEIPNFDSLKLQIESLFRDNVDERLPLCEIVSLPLDANKVILIRVPQSWRAPHMVRIAKDRYFMTRTNSGNQEMNTTQLRDSVLRTEGVLGGFNTFIRERAAKWRLTRSGAPFWMLQVSPLVANFNALDVTDTKLIRRLLNCCGLSRRERAHSVEGYRAFGVTGIDGQVGQTTFFRSGAVEVIDQRGFRSFEQNEKYFQAAVFEEDLFIATDALLSLYRDSVISCPLVFSLSVHDAVGFIIPGEGRDHGRRPLIESDVYADPIVLNELPTDFKREFRHPLNFIWNAFGFPKCPAYNLDGDYLGY